MRFAITNGDVILIVVLVTLPIAAIAFMGAGAALKQIGKGQFAIEEDLPEPKSTPPPPVSGEIREAEIRQMVEAKAYRQQARGEAPLDVEAEIGRLIDDRPASTALGGDDDLREEVRQLVIARNERRARQGEEPLDIDTEIERQLRELENLGQ